MFSSLGVSCLILHEQNKLMLIYVKCLHGGAASHTVLTELDDKKFFSRGMASIKSTTLYIS